MCAGLRVHQYRARMYVLTTSQCRRCVCACLGHYQIRVETVVKRYSNVHVYRVISVMVSSPITCSAPGIDFDTEKVHRVHVDSHSSQLHFPRQPNGSHFCNRHITDCR